LAPFLKLKVSVPMGTSCMKKYKTYGQMKFFFCLGSLSLSLALSVIQSTLSFLLGYGKLCHLRFRIFVVKSQVKNSFGSSWTVYKFTRQQRPELTEIGRTVLVDEKQRAQNCIGLLQADRDLRSNLIGDQSYIELCIQNSIILSII